MPDAAPSLVRPWLAGGARRVLAPAAVYLLAFVVLTWPAPRHAGDGLIGPSDPTGDVYWNVWNLWRLERDLAAGRSPFETDLVHHPFGTTLHGQTLGLFNAALGLPLRRALGLTLEQTYNLLLIGSFVAAGVTAFLLAHRLTGSWPGALAAGFVFTFSHWHVARGFGHLNLVASHMLPVFALCWLRLIDRPGLVASAAAAGAFALAGLCDLYFLAACALIGAALLAGRALEEGRAWLVERRRLVALVTFGALALLAAGPLAYPVAALHARDPLLISPTGNGDARDFSADLLALAVPGSSWRFAELTAPLSRRLASADAGDAALGLPVLALAAWVWRRRADAPPGARLRPWFLLLGVTVVLGLGPELQVAGHRTGLPLPWALLDWLPPVRLAGKPTRLLVVATLATAVITAVGVQRLLALPGRGRWLALAFALALLVDHAPPSYPAVPALREPPAYVRALRDADRGAVLHDPACGLEPPLYHQTRHGKPLAFGYLSRYPTSLLRREEPLIAAHLRGDWRTLRDTFRLRWLVVPAGVTPRNLADLRLVTQDAGGRLYELAPR